MWKAPSAPATACTTDVWLSGARGLAESDIDYCSGGCCPLHGDSACRGGGAGSWLARMSSVIPGGAVELWPGAVTAPGAVMRKVSGVVTGGPWVM